jgi:hypothetical protein
MGNDSKGRGGAGVMIGNMESSWRTDWVGSVNPGREDDPGKSSVK